MDLDDIVMDAEPFIHLHGITGTRQETFAPFLDVLGKNLSKNFLLIKGDKDEDLNTNNRLAG